MMQCKVEMKSNLILNAVSGLQFYDNPDVYIRELLANAIDACNTRAALEYSWGTEFLEMEEARMMNSMRPPYQPKISIVYNSMTQRLTVEDNGIGMNGQDIERYVSKVGQSYYTSESFEKQQLDYEPVSQFGMGMLSCFAVSRAMLIEAKKDKCVNTAWNIADQQAIEAVTAKWLEGTEEIEYITSNRETSGTKITLVLKPQYAMRLTHRGMVHAVLRYLMYPPFPIEVVYDQKKTILKSANPILDNPLADIAGIDPEVYGRQMFGAGSNLDEKTDREIFYQDFKKFAINDVTVGVGQVNAMGPEDIEKIKAKEVPFIDTVTGDGGLDVVYFLMTDISTECSYVLCSGKNADTIMSQAFGVDKQQDTYILKNVVSRKKQFLPAIMEAMEQ